MSSCWIYKNGDTVYCQYPKTQQKKVKPPRFRISISLFGGYPFEKKISSMHFQKVEMSLSLGVSPKLIRTISKKLWISHSLSPANDPFPIETVWTKNHYSKHKTTQKIDAFLQKCDFLHWQTSVGGSRKYRTWRKDTYRSRLEAMARSDSCLSR